LHHQFALNAHALAEIGHQLGFKAAQLSARQRQVPGLITPSVAMVMDFHSLALTVLPQSKSPENRVVRQTWRKVMLCFMVILLIHLSHAVLGLPVGGKIQMTEHVYTSINKAAHAPDDGFVSCTVNNL
jgi:hypothetical protein